MKRFKQCFVAHLDRADQAARSGLLETPARIRRGGDAARRHVGTNEEKATGPDQRAK